MEGTQHSPCPQDCSLCLHPTPARHPALASSWPPPKSSPSLGGLLTWTLDLSVHSKEETHLARTLGVTGGTVKPKLTDEGVRGSSISSLGPTSFPPGCGTGSPGPGNIPSSSLEPEVLETKKKKKKKAVQASRLLPCTGLSDYWRQGRHGSLSTSQRRCLRLQSVVPEAAGGGRWKGSDQSFWDSCPPGFYLHPRGN